MKLKGRAHQTESCTLGRLAQWRSYLAKSVEASKVEQLIRKYLEDRECQLSTPKKSGETGPDTAAKSGKSTWFVEVIGFQESLWIFSREFYEAFFRIISRD